MSNEQEQPRIDELLSEFYALQANLDQAMKDRDDHKIQEIQEQRKTILAEIRAIDPNFGEEKAA